MLTLKNSWWVHRETAKKKVCHITRCNFRSGRVRRANKWHSEVKDYDQISRTVVVMNLYASKKIENEKCGYCYY